jgi:Ca2+-binding EF-hand superfamily protein
MKEELFRRGFTILLNVSSFGLLYLIRYIVKKRQKSSKVKHANELLTFLENNLDKNQDGKVTFDDLYITVNRYKYSQDPENKKTILKGDDECG